MKDNILVSLIIPLYNEQRRLNRGLKISLSFFQKQNYAWELILVNDGSNDKTAKILKAHSKKKNISVLTSPHNFGKGHAIKQGVMAARGKYIFFSDIDFSVPISFINIFVNKLKRHDIVIGSRKLKDSKIKQHQNYWREFLGRGFTRLSNQILGLNHSDLTCGFKGYQHKVAKILFTQQQILDWAFDSEILFLAKKYKFKVKEFPVSWKNDPLTKVNMFTDSLNSLKALLEINVNNWLGRYTNRQEYEG